MWTICELIIEGVFFLALTFGALYIGDRMFGKHENEKRQRII